MSVVEPRPAAAPATQQSSLPRDAAAPLSDEHAAVAFTWPDFGLSSQSVVIVPAELVHRARWVLSWPAPSEAELNFLATGKFD